MTKYTAVIEGMSCSMCEAHINDVIRAEFKVKKVKSDRKSNTAVIIAEDGAVDEEKLAAAIARIGYTYKGLSSEPYVKRGLFG
ncbi:MAG: heavy-metal-associated domain-containing protein [Solobacterium sp.]|nr:heavy-metal-associated domain-containing protein [Solobacterium sp.]